MHPKKGKDFDILFNELEAWRLNETKKIKSSNELSPVGLGTGTGYNGSFVVSSVVSDLHFKTI
jgi:hypothetical protein